MLVNAPHRMSGGVSSLTRRMVPGGSVTSFPSVAAIVPPPPISTPRTAPLAPPRIPPMIAPTADPAPMRPTSPLMPFALERLRDRAAHGIVAAAHGNLIECYRQTPLPIGTARLVNRADDAAHDGTGWNERAVPVVKVHHRRRFEPIFDLRCPRAQLALQANVDLLTVRNRPLLPPARSLSIVIDTAAARTGRTRLEDEDDEPARPCELSPCARERRVCSRSRTSV